jgi:hypothetical protein
MKLSSIQVISLTFRRLQVEVDLEQLRAAPAEPTDAHALLQGVLLNTEVSFSPLPERDERGVRHFVRLRLQIHNQLEGIEPPPRPSPYLIDLEGGAVIAMQDDLAAREDAEDLLRINGASLIWGAMREQLAQLTSRMPAGTALLPAVSFQDLKRAPDDAPAPAAAEPAAAPKAARPRRRKS